MLGVCLGHQCIVEVFGGTVEPRPAAHARQGRAACADRRPTRCSTICRSRSRPAATTRWPRSRRCPRSSRSRRATPTARSWPCATASSPHLHGLQFHPESVLTPDGDRHRPPLPRPRGDGGPRRRPPPRPGRRPRTSPWPRPASLLAGESLTAAETEQVIGARHARRGHRGADRRAARRPAAQGRDGRRDRRRRPGDARARRRRRARRARTWSTPRARAATGCARSTSRPLAGLVAAGGRRRRRQARQPRRSLVVAARPTCSRRSACRSTSRPSRSPRCIDEVGFGFLFAPAHHPAMRHAGPVRRSLGVRTIFNVLGPLTNPVGARRQLVGVFAEELVRADGRDAAALGMRARAGRARQRRASTSSRRAGPSICADRHAGRRHASSTIDPRALGLAPCAHRRPRAAATPPHNAEITAARCSTASPARDATPCVLNAAAALVAAGRAAISPRGLALGGRPPRSTTARARTTLDRLVDVHRGSTVMRHDYLDGDRRVDARALEERRQTRSLVAALIATRARRA